MGTVLYPHFVTSLDIPAERVLQAAIDAGVTDIVLAGYDADGTEYFASSMADGGDALWLLERCKKRLLDAADEVDR
jgi:hypothetical protein